MMREYHVRFCENLELKHFNLLVDQLFRKPSPGGTPSFLACIKTPLVWYSIPADLNDKKTYSKKLFPEEIFCNAKSYLSNR